MSEVQQIAKIVIQKKSVFKIKDFYDFLYKLVTSLGFDVLEDLYNNSEGNTSIEWSCIKFVDDYVQYKIWIQCKFNNANKVKVKREGITESMVKADVKITIKPKVITDWQSRWDTNPVTKFLKGLYDKYLFKPTFDDRKKELLEFSNLISSEVKSFFELPRFI